MRRLEENKKSCWYYPGKVKCAVFTMESFDENGKREKAMWWGRLKGLGESSRENDKNLKQLKSKYKYAGKQSVGNVREELQNQNARIIRFAEKNEKK